MNNPRKSFGVLLFGLAAVAGVALGACRQDDANGDSGPSFAVTSSCNDYCSQAKLCNDDLNEEKCRDNCEGTLTNCQVDEQDAALDKLDQCAKESCDDFIGCTVNVGAKCIFGI